MYLVTKVKDEKSFINGAKDSREVKVKFKYSPWLEFHWKAKKSTFKDQGVNEK